ncbi:MAG: efflux transporter outer membrane subunit [Proteobacteria bacterium]|nr:efflux transporter outer membrane subunit [Pseudomonadota bacterium]
MRACISGGLLAPVLAALTTVLGAVAGCTLGPNYHPAPPTPGAAGPLVSVSPSAETSAEPPDDWWRLYHDPTLDRLLDEAFKANTDLKAAEANLQAASAALDIARDAFLPQTKAEIGSTRGRDGLTDEILELTGRRPQTIWIHEAALSLGYELDYLGRVRRSVESARADAEAVAAVHDSVKITVAAETARSYAQICAFGEQIEVAKRSLDIVSREADITVHRNEAGAGSQFDVVRAQQLVAQVRASIPPLEGQRRAAVFQLAALLGRAPSMAPTEVNPCVLPPHLSDLVPVGDGTGLLKRRPDVRQADRRMASATARIGIATADLYPRITLKALYGTVTADINEFTAPDSVIWGIGPSVSWTFPNMAGPRARVRAAKASAAAALANFDSVVLKALKETEQSLSTYGSELERRQALSDAQQKAHQAFDMAHNQFLAGSLSNLDLLTTEQALVAADAAVAISDTALIQDQIAVFKALGGGWRGVEVGRR